MVHVGFSSFWVCASAAGPVHEHTGTAVPQQLVLQANICAQLLLQVSKLKTFELREGLQFDALQQASLAIVIL